MGSPSHSSGSIPIPTGLRHRTSAPRRPLAPPAIPYEAAEALLRLHAQRVAEKNQPPTTNPDALPAASPTNPAAVPVGGTGQFRITDVLGIAIAWASLFFAAASVPLLAPPSVATRVGLALAVCGALIALFPDRVSQLEGWLTARRANGTQMERLVIRLVGIGAIASAWWMV